MNRLWNEWKRNIATSKTTGELRAIRNEFHTSFSAALHAEDTRTYVDGVNEFHDLIIKRTLSIAEERVRESWSSFPVSSFAFLLFGSGGRKEQTLWSDQDNGMIYTEPEDTDPAVIENFVATFGELTREHLEQVGYPPCEGNVLISNPSWRKSLDGWKRTYRGWFSQPEFETVRHLLIMADTRVIYGGEHYAAELHGEFNKLITEQPNMLQRMLSNTLRYKVLIGVLGNLLTEPYGEDAGGIDIKYGAYIPMVNAIRLLSLSRGIAETSTLQRIRSLEGFMGITSLQTADWENAFMTILKFRAMTPFQIEEDKYTTRGILSARLLSKDVKRELKQALRIGADLQKLVKRMFGTEGHL